MNTATTSATTGTAAETVQPTVVDGRVQLTFARKGRATTHWIEGQYPVDSRPDAMFAALEAAGWRRNEIYDHVPAYEATDYDHAQPVGQRLRSLGYQVQEFAFSKPGSDLFAGWTAEEKAANMRQARAVLRRFGFSRVPVWAKTWRDLV